MKTQKTLNIQQFTKLPISVVEVGNKILPDIFINTPHKGAIEIKLTEKHYPFLFGSVSQIEKNASEVLNEIFKIEKEAKDYLLEQWLLSTN